MQRYPFDAVRERLRSHQGDYLDFALGRHHEQTPQSVLEILREHSALALERGAPQDAERLDRSIRAWLERWYGIDTGGLSVLPAPGGRLAAGALIGALLQPADRVVVTEPTYPVFSRLANEAAAQVDTSILDPARDFAPDPTPIGTATRLVALNYPNNPTGALLSSEAFAELRGRGSAETIWFNDATYGPLTHSGRPSSLLASPDRGGLIELYSLAKFFNLGPWPVSFLVGDSTLLAQLQRFVGFAWTPLSALHLRVAIHCLEDDTRLEAVKHATGQRLARLQRTLDKMGFETYPAHGGIYLLGRVPDTIGGQPVHAAADASELLLSRYDIAVMPWDVPGHAYLRWSTAYGETEITALESRGRDGVLATYA